jgi:Tol biopolymer transport system component
VTRHAPLFLALAFLSACGSAKAPLHAGDAGTDAADAGPPVDTAASPPDADASPAGADTSLPEVLPGGPDAIDANPVAPLTLDDVTPPAARAGDAYALPLQARGGTPPYTWTVAAGALPGSLSLAAGAGGGAQVAGNPAHAGSTAVTIQVADAAGATAARAFTLLVRGRPWAAYRAMGMTFLVDLARDDAPPVDAVGVPLQQPGGSIDVVQFGFDVAAGGSARLNGSLQGLDLGGAQLGAAVSLVAPEPDGVVTTLGLPTWSANGSWLAYRGGALADATDLFVADTTLRPGIPRHANGARAAGDTVSSFDWVGASLVYSVWNKDRGTSLHLASAATPGATKVLGAAPGPNSWSVSPDQTRLIFSIREQSAPQHAAYLLVVGGQQPSEPMRLDGALFGDDGASPMFLWAADSTELEVTGQGPNGNAALFRRDLATPNATPQLLFEGPCKTGSFVRSADQRWLAFVGCGLWLARRGGAGPLAFQQLVAAPGEDDSGPYGVAWTPDGRRLTYISKSDLQSVDTTGDAPGTPVSLYAGLPGGHKKHLFAPDGSKLAVRVVNGPLQQVFLIPFTGAAPGAPIKMSADASPGAYQYTPDRAGEWSADGTRFVYEALVEKAFQVFAVNVEGSVPSGARRISAIDHDVDCCESPHVIQR